MLRMESIKSGMTRGDLLQVFAHQGGFYSPLDPHQIYVSRDCPYFKVEIVFQSVRRPSDDADFATRTRGDERDVIKTVSRPYLGWAVTD